MTMASESKAGGAEKRGAREGIRSLASIVGLTLIVAAVVRELRLPARRRTWHGVLFGRIPYDLRLPSVQRVVRTMWDPDNRRLLVPTAFGVGWSLNAAALLAPVRGRGR